MPLNLGVRNLGVNLRSFLSRPSTAKTGSTGNRVNCLTQTHLILFLFWDSRRPDLRNGPVHLMPDTEFTCALYLGTIG